MDPNLASSLCRRPSLHLTKSLLRRQTSLFSAPARFRHQALLPATRAATGTDDCEPNADDTKDGATATPGTAPPRPQPTTLNIRYRPRSRNQARRQRQQQQQQQARTKPPPKDWDSMTLGEKAVELYMGEKGLLFWLNKFAYASIFIIIGGWILFRFVGPNLGLYQLDAPPLPPSNMFKG